MFLWLKRRYLAVGIEIGISSYKMAALEFSGKTVQLAAVEQWESLNHQFLSALIQRYPRHEAAVTMPSSQVDIRYFNLPNLSGDDLKNMVGYEIEPQLGYRLEEACYDFTHAYANGISTTTRPIIAFASRKAHVKALTERFSASQLNLKVVDVAAMALLNLYREITPDFDHQSLTGIDVGQKSASILIARKGYLCFTRDFPLHTNGGLIGRAGDDDIAQELAMEIRRTIQYCQIQYQLGNGEIQQALLSGDRFPNELLAEQISEKLKIPCRVVDPFHAASLGGTFAEGVEKAAGYAIAAGLAYRLGREWS